MLQHRWTPWSFCYIYPIVPSEHPVSITSGLHEHYSWYQHNILKKPDVDRKCWLCGRFDETSDRLVSGCPELARTEYIHRHNKAAAHMQWKICKEFGIEVKERWYEHEPNTVTENESVTILWDGQDRHWQDQSSWWAEHCAKEHEGLNLPSHWHDCTPRHQHLSYNHGKAYQIKRLGNRGWANVGVQNNNGPGGYGSPRHHQEGHGKLLQQNPWQHQHRWELQKITLLSTVHLLRRVLSIK